MASPWPHFPRSLEFGSHFVYPSPVATAAEQNAKAFLLRVKQDFISPVPPHERLIDRAVARIHQAWLQVAAPTRSSTSTRCGFGEAHDGKARRP